MENTMLTTTDNPYNPFIQYALWSQYDIAAGYHTEALLGRLAALSEDLGDKSNALALSLAIDEIVKYNVSGMHTKVYAPNTTL